MPQWPLARVRVRLRGAPFGLPKLLPPKAIIHSLAVFIITEHRQKMNKLLLRGVLAKLGIAGGGEHEVLGQRF
jgi:hypothetical protein